MPIEPYIINIIKIMFTIIGGHLAITKILPLLKDFLDDFIKEDKVMKGLVSLLTVFIIVTVITLVIDFIASIGNPILNYITYIKPAIDIFSKLFDYLQYIVAAVLISYAIKNFKK
jgi:ABC-type multidrug transport system fused ATPase/permease subunit